MSNIFFSSTLTETIMKDPKTYNSYVIAVEAVNKVWFWKAF